MSARRTLQHVPIILLVSMLFEWTAIRFTPPRGIVLGLPFDLRWLGLLFPLAVLAVVLLSFRYGRVFCSWFCPTHLYLEGIRRLTSRGGRWRRPLQWAVAAIIAALTAQALLTFCLPLAQQLESYRNLGLSSRIFKAWAILFVLLFLPLGIFLWRFCVHACPYGLLMRLFKTDTTPVTSFDADAGRCIACRACDGVCPYELDVRQQSEGDLCTNCGLCITACHTVLGDHRGVLSLLDAPQKSSDVAA